VCRISTLFTSVTNIAVGCKTSSTELVDGSHHHVDLAGGLVVGVGEGDVHEGELVASADTIPRSGGDEGEGQRESLIRLVGV
jgi:hypothetical protein